MHRPAIPITCLTLEGIFRLLHSSALSVAIAQHTVPRWEAYKDSKFLNAVYSLKIFGEGPGWMTIDQDWKAIGESREFWFNRFVNGFLTKLDAGPSAVMTYLERIEKLGEDSRLEIQRRHAEVSAINREIIADTGDAIRRLAKIKVVSTVLVALGSGGAALAGSGAGYGVVSFSFSVATKVAKNVAEAKEAKVLAIDVSKEIGKEATTQGLEMGGELAGALGNWKLFQASHSPQWREAVAKIEALSREIARKSSTRKIAKLSAKQDRILQHAVAHTPGVQSGVKLIQRGRLAAKAGVGLSVVFAALDIIDAIQEYQEDVAGL